MPHRFPALLDPNSLPRRVAVLAPHPDDELLGCGGMIAFHAERGDDPMIIFLSDGAAGDPTGRARDLAAVRRAESAAAMAVLGARRIEYLQFPDGRLEECADAAGRIADALARAGAELVYAPSPLECHADHIAAADAAVAALAKAPAARVHLFGVNTAVPANVLYDVSRYRAKKDAAFEKYASQMAVMDLRRASRAMDAARTVNIPDATVTDCEGFAAMSASELPAVYDAFRAVRVRLYPSA